MFSTSLTIESIILRNFVILTLRITFSLLKEAYIQAYPTQQPEEPIEQVGLISFKKKNSDEVEANDIEDNRLPIDPYEDEVRIMDLDLQNLRIY